MIGPETLSAAWVYVNNKGAFERTGHLTTVLLCFKTNPESRIAAFVVKNEGGGYDYKSTQITMEIGQETRRLLTISGGIAQELEVMARKTMETVKAGIGLHWGHIYLVKGSDVKDVPLTKAA